ncbi:MAG: hypothetical protein ACXWMX_01825 [Candidatus Limnocylindrales bacterium]
MTLQLHRPDGRGGLERRPVSDADWRRQLRSPRWGVPRLANTEMNPTSTGVSILFWTVLAALTFVLLLAGYGTGFWH